MHREDNSKFLLYIEPLKENKSFEPVEDDILKIIELAISNSKKGTANYSRVEDSELFHKGGGWRGMHTTNCGERSTNCDYLLENGMITNSLAPFYLKWYRNAIPETEMNKVLELVKFYEH